MKFKLLLMAAGRSQRFKATHNGMHKFLYPISEYNQPMLSVTYAIATQVFTPDNICIVVNKEELEVQDAAKELGSQTLIIQSSGIGESIAQAVRANQNYDGLLILHADLPFIQASSIEKVCDALQTHLVVRPAYQGKFGHPVGFQKQLFPELRQLQGDKGANPILKNFPVFSLEVNDPGIIYDIDTLQDLNNYSKL